ncbi:unnamed protein product [Prorocentrum cordatum]|uniref:Solute carrier family 40 protein n=1 Tax=Prorocentrum cordatum TaxID=2364126 RepID=A0ABN9R876_9DINO|nr:unnamed protein product [Polarella glacialis]
MAGAAGTARRSRCWRRWTAARALPSVDARHSSNRRVTLLVLCLIYVCLSASGPIVLDWVKRGHGGSFGFSVPALTFHAWALASLMGLSWTAYHGQLRQLLRLDMLWRFCVTTSMFTVGDMLSFASLQHLDVGTFSLVGKTCAIILTVLLTLITSATILHKRQTALQYGLVVIVAACTYSFCLAEQAAHATVRAAAKASIPVASGLWMRGLVQRIFAVFFTSLGAVLQERSCCSEILARPSCCSSVGWDAVQ